MAIHRDLPETELHEPKGIVSATTADAGKVITPSASNDGQGELRAITRQEIGYPPAYGSMTMTNSTSTISVTQATDSTLATNNDYVEVTLSMGFNNLKNMGSGTNNLVIQNSGVYQVDFWANLKSDTNSTIAAIKFVVNDTDFVARRPKALLPNPADPGNISGSGVHDFTAGDTVKLYVAATKNCNITIEDMAFTLNLVEVV